MRDAREPNQKAASRARASPQQRPRASDREGDERLDRLLAFHGSFGNQAVQRAGNACPDLAACPTGGACEECRQKAAEGSQPESSTVAPAQILRFAQDDREAADTAPGHGAGSSVIPSAARDLGGGEVAEAPGTATAPSAAFLVDDPSSATDPAQMSKQAFLAELRSQVTTAADGELAGTGRAARDCPWIEHWFGYYQERSAAQVEQALHRWEPATASAASAMEYMPPVVERVRTSVAHWAATGEVTGVPHDGLASLAQRAASSRDPSVPAGATSLLFQAREGGPRAPANLESLQRRLGEGESLDAPVRSRMEGALGASFGGVKVHRDANAAALASEVNARAFALGNHVAFGAGEYRPGSVVGDALIAHELTHVAQQQGAATGGAGGADYGALEADADRSAAGAVASMWAGATDGAAGMAARAGPALRSGLRLQRCGPIEQKLEINPLIKPEPRSCGGVRYVTTWELAASASDKGGYVLQDVTFDWTTKDKAGATPADPDHTSPVRYFEAWRVEPSSRRIKPVTADTWDWPELPPKAGPDTKGGLKVTATAKFHDGLDSLPSHMVPNNPKTFALDLPSSTTDPALGGTISNEVKHSLKTHWDCVAKPESKTVVDSHDP